MHTSSAFFIIDWSQQIPFPRKYGKKYLILIKISIFSKIHKTIIELNPIIRVFPLKPPFFPFFYIRKGMGKKKLRENFSNQNIETHNSHTFYLLFQKSVETKSQILRNLITNFSYSSFPADSIHYTILYFDIAHSSFLFCSLLSKIPRNMIAKEFFYIFQENSVFDQNNLLWIKRSSGFPIFSDSFFLFFSQKRKKIFSNVKKFPHHLDFRLRLVHALLIPFSPDTLFLLI